MSDAPVTLDFIGRQIASIQAEQRRMRADFDTMMALVVGQNDWNRRCEARLVGFEARLVGFEQRLVDQTDIPVAELTGRTGISQSMTSRRLDDIEERVQELETGKSRFTP